MHQTICNWWKSCYHQRQLMQSLSALRHWFNATRCLQNLTIGALNFVLIIAYFLASLTQLHWKSHFLVLKWDFKWVSGASSLHSEQGELSTNQSSRRRLQGNRGLGKAFRCLLYLIYPIERPGRTNLISITSVASHFRKILLWKQRLTKNLLKKQSLHLYRSIQLGKFPWNWSENH